MKLAYLSLIILGNLFGVSYLAQGITPGVAEATPTVDETAFLDVRLIQIISPQGSETFKAGSAVQISFTRQFPWLEEKSPKEFAFVLVEYIPSNKMCILIYPPPPGCEPKTNVINHIANIPFTSTSASYSFSWKIPKSIPYSDKYRVRVGGTYEPPDMCLTDPLFPDAPCKPWKMPVYKMYNESNYITVLPSVTISSPVPTIVATPAVSPSAPINSESDSLISTRAREFGQSIRNLVKQFAAIVASWF